MPQLCSALIALLTLCPMCLSVCVGWVMEGLPDVVAQACFLDPVNLLLCCPDGTYIKQWQYPRGIT